MVNDQIEFQNKCGVNKEFLPAKKESNVLETIKAKLALLEEL